LDNAEGGHDWFHIERVYKNAMLISQNEVCDLTVLKLGALLHDIADSKFNDGDESVGPKVATLSHKNVDQSTIDHVVKIIENISYKGGNFEKILLNRIRYRAGRGSIRRSGNDRIARTSIMAGLRIERSMT
jgi:uncharacterized protein